jgi:Transposase, Mutator family
MSPRGRTGCIPDKGRRSTRAGAGALSAKRYMYFWVDGIHVQARLEDAAQRLLVIIGATPEGKKELVGLIDGVRESAQSWKELLLDLKRRGLEGQPSPAADVQNRARMAWTSSGQTQDYPSMPATLSAGCSYNSLCFLFNLRGSGRDGNICFIALDWIRRFSARSIDALMCASTASS